MSATWRERLQRAKKRLKEALGLSEADWQFMQENIGDFCRESDEQVRTVEGERCNVDAVVEKMDETTFIEHCESVINDVMVKLKYKKGRKKKKSEQEDEDDVDSNVEQYEAEKESEEEKEIEN